MESNSSLKRPTPAPIPNGKVSFSQAISQAVKCCCDTFRHEHADNHCSVQKKSSFLDEAKRQSKTEASSAAKLTANIGKTIRVIVGEVGEPDEDGDRGATGRSQADAPEIDGAVYLRQVPEGLKAGDFVTVAVEDADAHDLFGVIAE